jgi:phosphoketolase
LEVTVRMRHGPIHNDGTATRRHADPGSGRNRPVIFAFHGYPWLIHRLTNRRANHQNIHARGYQEEGTITTPFDLTVLNDLDLCDWRWRTHHA